MQLLTVGCLSLTTKMQESNSLKFASFYDGGFKFPLKSIQRMELLILCTLDWKMGLIIPFAFLQYFINILFAKLLSWSTVIRILELIMASFSVIGLEIDQKHIRAKDQCFTPCSKCFDIVSAYFAN
ncbi:hypothetical protein V2J09_016745 [Rumex salicifolius]